ncbi:hypothetical protein BSKO_11285 [Bryopsis sp. KO-2023]|nr:hypothetical protein BSKO_11285 [Bryopsis sp. KO-2023]
MGVLILLLLLTSTVACVAQRRHDEPAADMVDPHQREVAIESNNKKIRVGYLLHVGQYIHIKEPLLGKSLGVDDQFWLEVVQGEDVAVSHAYETVNVKNLPKAFFWGDVDGVNYLTETRNQNVPRKCFGCWAFAVTSSLSDRINIMRKGKSPQVILSAQALLNCKWGGNCQGGNPHKAFEMIKEHGIPDETCQPYVGREENCDAQGMCKVCGKGKESSQCEAVEEFPRYRVSEYGWILGGIKTDAERNALSGPHRIKSEVYKNGPIPCTVRATDKLRAYKGGIFSELVWNLVPNHVVTIVGWGAHKGEEVAIGNPLYNLGIELFCAYGIPDIPEPETTPSPPEAAAQIQVKDSYDIRNIDGLSYATLMRNQRIPQNCNSGWAHSAMSVLINCGTRKDESACEGKATPQNAFHRAMKVGVVDDTCSAYEGVQLKCRRKNVCRICNSRNCHKVEKGTYRMFTVEEFGKVSGDSEIMKEIAANGPVACGVCTNDGFEQYSSGILKSDSTEPCTEPDHYVAVSGFGTEEGLDFWVVRNSYGTYWGEQGWAKIARGPKIDCGLHRACYWATPSSINYDSPYNGKKMQKQHSDVF